MCLATSYTYADAVKKKICCKCPVRQGGEAHILNSLKIGEIIGRGGFGVVQKCYWRGSTFALKCFHHKWTKSRAFHESYEAEKSVIKLNHPNIVRTFQVFQSGYRNYVLMEYVAGRTLQEVIDDPREPIGKRRRYEICADIARGLQHAHRHNIAHLDLKPANILVTAVGGVCKVADFGCCTNVGENNSPSTPTKSNLTGTYAYRAPELLRGETATLKADLYSFGICMWQLLVRDRPYGREHHQVIIFKVVAYNHRPEIPTGLDRDIIYETLLKQCWRTERESRPDIEDVITRLT